MISKYISRIQIKYFNSNIIDETNFDYEDQRRFLEGLKEPKNDFDRTYLQHMCQMKQLKPIIRLLLNMVSMVAFPFFAFYFVFKSFFTKKSIPEDSDCIVFLWCSNGKAIYPKELEKKYNKVIEADFFEGKSLLLKDLFFVLGFIKQYPLTPWLSLRMLFRIDVYRFLIHKYNHKAIVVTIEVNPSASSLTYFC